MCVKDVCNWERNKVSVSSRGVCVCVCRRAAESVEVGLRSVAREKGVLLMSGPLLRRSKSLS